LVKYLRGMLGEVEKLVFAAALISGTNLVLYLIGGILIIGGVEHVYQMAYIFIVPVY